MKTYIHPTLGTVTARTQLSAQVKFEQRAGGIAVPFHTFREADPANAAPKGDINDGKHFGGNPHA